MELTEMRTSTDRLRFSHSHRHKIYSGEEEREEEEAHLRGELSHYDSTMNMMESQDRHQQAAAMSTTATYVDSSSYRRLLRASSNNTQNHNVSFEGHLFHHPWGRVRSFSRSVSSLSNSSCGSDSDTGGVQTMITKSSAKSSPISSDSSMTNYDFNRTDSGACSATTIAGVDTGGEMETDDRMRGFSYSSTPSAEELSLVFTWVDENDDGLICRADLRGFMSRVLNFEISDSEAETLLVVYSNGRTLRTDTSLGGRRTSSGGAVVDFEGFLALYQCLCGEQASPEEQSMMAAASQVFDTTQLRSGRWG